MKSALSILLTCFSLGLGISIFCVPTVGQEVIDSTPNNQDKALREEVVTDRAASYYHFALARWHLNNGNPRTAISEMRQALRYSNQSASIHMELAILMGRTGNIVEAIEHAEEAIRLDPHDPEPHWLLADIYIRGRGRRGAPPDSLQKGVRQLEKIREMNPNDARVHFNLGGLYFEMNEPAKAIQSYETFQKLSGSVDNGYREIAKYYENTGDFEKAVDYLNKGLNAQPNSAESLWMLGGIYSRLNRNLEAIPVYKKLLAVIGENTEITRRLAMALFEAGEYEEAVNFLQDLVERANPDRTSLIYYGRARMELHDYREAIRVFQKLIENIPDDIEARFYLGRSFQKTGRYSEASDIFRSLVEKSAGGSEEASANRAVFQQHLAAVYMELAEYQKAFAVYEEMAAVEPGVRGQLLNAYRIGRQFDKALDFGRNLFEKDPGNIPVAIIYAHTLADAGKIVESIELLKKLLKSNPDSLDLYINLSRIYVQEKLFSEADEILNRAESMDLGAEDRERLKFHRAAFYERKKDFDRAEELFREMLKENPGNPMVLNYLGYMLADRGVRLDEAVRYIKEALAIDPYNGAYLDSLGWAFYQMGELEKAETYLLKANEIVRNDPTINEHLGDLYFKIGDLEKARQYWMKAVSIGTEQEEIQKVRQKLDNLQNMIENKKR
ncbi:MAG TPA: tetratricopeptide repeat protein [Acidobacteriota bacterium]|nr:tetratricopeptide repeat protein [Acidobacteriota bacterium]